MDWRTLLSRRDGRDSLRADDGIRTRDPHLGKVMLYQLSHVRIAPLSGANPVLGAVRNNSRVRAGSQTVSAARVGVRSRLAS